MMHIWGVIGAALMTGIAVVIGQGIIMNWYYWKKTGLNMLLFWKNVGKIYIIPSIMCIVVLIISYKVNFYKISYLCFGIVVYTGIYCY